MIAVSPGNSLPGTVTTWYTSPLCGSVHATVFTEATRLASDGISDRQSPRPTSAALTEFGSKISSLLATTTATTAIPTSTHTADNTRPAIAIPRPPWPCLALLSPTNPQITLIRTPPRTPKISDTTAHQLVPDGRGGG